MPRHTSKKTKPPTKETLLKMEIATEIGLSDKIRKHGWGALNAKESGRIGGIITQRIKKGIIKDYTPKK